MKLRFHQVGFHLRTMGDCDDMMIPEMAGSTARISASQRRSSYIRKAHAKLKRKLMREYLMIVGKKSKSFVQPIPARALKMPTSGELANYW